MLRGKKGQEEMVGFALIIIVVAVILLVFLSLTVRKSDKESVENYEVNGFIQASLQYSTSCEDKYGNVDIQDIIFNCNSNEYWENGENSCDIMETTLQNIVQESWKVSEDSPVKGYEFMIYSSGEEIFSFEEGNITNNYKSGSQDFIKRGSSIDILFTVYY